jgi:hypothetical protein
MIYRAVALAVAVGMPCVAADAAIFFTFQDPGPEQELTIEEQGDGSLDFSYSFTQLVALSITSDDGEVPATVFSQTRLTLDMQSSTSPIVDDPNLLVTELSGSFVFEDVSGMDPVTILSGNFDQAITTLLRGEAMGMIEASGSVAGDTVVGSLSLTAGEALRNLFAEPESFLAGRQTASFALSNLTGDADDDLATLMGSAAFTGSSQLIPTPGTGALFGIGGAIALRRRR